MKRLFNMCHNLVAGKSYSPIIVQEAFLPSSYHNYVWQQFRTDTTTENTIKTTTVACWNCKKSVAPRNHMICTECGHLQDVNSKINYYDLLNFPIGFGLETKELSQRFRQLQSLVHPDKFSNKSERERENSSEWSALINRAYKTLVTPIERGRYLLKIHGHNVPQDNSALNKKFLMEIMEANEQVDETNDLEQLKILHNNAVHAMDEEAIELSKQFEVDAFDKAIQILIKMKYLQSLQESIKHKIEKICYNGN